MGNAALYDALAARLGVPVEHLAAGTGSVGRAHHLLQAPLRPGRRGRLRLAVLRGLPDLGHGRRRRLGAGAAAPTRRHDLDAMAAAVTDRTRLVIVCTPNNPTGAVGDRHRLRAVPRAGARATCWSCVDEAYREFVRDADAVDALALVDRARRTSWCCAPSPRPTAWPVCASATRSPSARRSPPRCGALALPFGVTSSRRPRPSRAGRGGRAQGAGRGARRRARPRRGGAARARLVDVPDTAGQLRLAALGDRHRRVRRPWPRRPASPCGRSPARACG